MGCGGANATGPTLTMRTPAMQGRTGSGMPSARPSPAPGCWSSAWPPSSTRSSATRPGRTPSRTTWPPSTGSNPCRARNGGAMRSTRTSPCRTARSTGMCSSPSRTRVSRRSRGT
ncbi:hypothetical protein ACFFX0_23235 [Citricoccus parietis]|uniref:Uncharacterized protein n=1 Tax=Citricoccus parietis TaxID=592307 RepID=A0ABV5G6A8_9MICC